MKEISTIGLDIAKSVIQFYAISDTCEIVVRRQFEAPPGAAVFAGPGPCLIGMEAVGK